MKRPDQDRFNLFSRHFATIDDRIRQFAVEHGLKVVKNQNRWPCRILRRASNPLLIIDIYLDVHWLEVEYREDLPHSMGVASYYQPSQGKRLFKKAVILEHQPFCMIQTYLEQFLNEGWRLLESWPAPVLTPGDPDATEQGWTRTRF